MFTFCINNLDIFPILNSIFRYLFLGLYSPPQLKDIKNKKYDSAINLFATVHFKDSSLKNKISCCLYIAAFFLTDISLCLCLLRNIQNW